MLSGERNSTKIKIRYVICSYSIPETNNFQINEVRKKISHYSEVLINLTLRTFNFNQSDIFRDPVKQFISSWKYYNGMLGSDSGLRIKLKSYNKKGLESNLTIVDSTM